MCSCFFFLSGLHLFLLHICWIAWTLILNCCRANLRTVEPKCSLWRSASVHCNKMKSLFVRCQCGSSEEDWRDDDMWVLQMLSLGRSILFTATWDTISHLERCSKAGNRHFIATLPPQKTVKDPNWGWCWQKVTWPGRNNRFVSQVAHRFGHMFFQKMTKIK